MWSQEMASTWTSSATKAPRWSRISQSSPVQMPENAKGKKTTHDVLVAPEARPGETSCAVLVLEGEVRGRRAHRSPARWVHVMVAQSASRVSGGAVLGATSLVPVQSSQALTVPEVCRPAVSRGLLDVAGARRGRGGPALGVSSTTKPRSPRLVRASTSGVDEVAVVLAPPEQDGVGDVAVVLVLELGAGEVLDGEAEARRRRRSRSRTPGPPGPRRTPACQPNSPAPPLARTYSHPSPRPRRELCRTVH